MATFNPGTDGDLKSTSFEDALAELIVKMNELEVAQSVNRVAWTLNPTLNQFEFSGTLPYSAVLNTTNGKLVLEMTEYIDDPAG